MSNLEVYWGSGSQPAWRVLLALALKQIPYESKLLSFSDREHKTPEFLEINPRGKVPAIKHDGFVLYESSAIIQYLDDAFPGVQLFGQDPKERAAIQKNISEQLSYLWEPGREVTRALFRDKVDGAEEELAEKREKLWKEMWWIDQQIGESFAASDQPSAADVYLYPGVQAMRRAWAKPSAEKLGWNRGELDEFKNVDAWVTRMDALPGVQETFPPHWK